MSIAPSLGPLSMMLCSFMGGVSFGGRAQRPRFGLSSPEGCTAFSSFIHLPSLPRRLALSGKSSRILIREMTALSEELMAKVQELIDNSINPAVAGHGGFVQLIDVKDNRVYLQMGGGCQGCGAADITLKAGNRADDQ